MLAQSFCARRVRNLFEPGAAVPALILENWHISQYSEDRRVFQSPIGNGATHTATHARLTTTGGPAEPKQLAAGPKPPCAGLQSIFRLKKLEFCYRLLPRWSGSLRWNCSTLSAGIRDLPLVIS